MELITVGDAASLLGISTKRIYQLIETGRLETLKLGPRTTRITRASLDAFLAERIRAERRDRGIDIMSGGRRNPTGHTLPTRARKRCVPD